MRLLLFNPENDLALASGDAHYTPPASALAMARDMQDFPMLWAEGDDVILRRDSSVVDAQGALVATTLSQVAASITAVFPWGWSPLLVRQLRDAGLPDALLPTVEEMKAYRSWASRQTAVKLLAQLREQWPDAFAPEGNLLRGESVWCITEDQVRTAHQNYGRSMFKAPWSGSGRGVHPVTAALTEKDIAWMRRVLRMQGGVEVEPFYTKVRDLALEFWAVDGQVRYQGLSLFSTTAGGVYSGNVVASEAEKEAMLAPHLSLHLLSEVRQRLCVLLSHADLPAWYMGPVGVDMMILQDGYLHPLVEINLRATMGWAALHASKE